MYHLVSNHWNHSTPSEIHQETASHLIIILTWILICPRSEKRTQSLRFYIPKSMSFLNKTSPSILSDHVIQNRVAYVEFLACRVFIARLCCCVGQAPLIPIRIAPDEWGRRPGDGMRHSLYRRRLFTSSCVSQDTVGSILRFERRLCTSSYVSKVTVYIVLCFKTWDCAV